MSKQPGVKATIELLERLKDTAHDFATREEKINHDFAVKVSAERRRRDTAITELNSKLAETISHAEENLQTAKQSANSRFEARKGRIKKAHKASQWQGVNRIEEHEGNRKSKLQAETMRLTRNRKADLEKVETAFAEYNTSLTKPYEALTELTHKVPKAFRGFGKFKRLFSSPAANVQIDPSLDQHQLLIKLSGAIQQAQNDYTKLHQNLLLRFLNFWPIWLVLALCPLALVPLLQHFGNNSFTYLHAGITTGILIVIGFVLHQVVARQASVIAGSTARSLNAASKLYDLCLEKSGKHHQQELDRIESKLQGETAMIQARWAEAAEEAFTSKESSPQKIDQKEIRASTKNAQLHRDKLKSLEADFLASTENVKREVETRSAELQQLCAEKEIKYKQEHDTQWASLETEWKTTIPPLYETIADTNAVAAKTFPSWLSDSWKNWTPPHDFVGTVKFAHLEVDLEKLAGAIPKDPRLLLPGEKKFNLPVSLSYPNEGSLLLETTEAGRPEAMGALNNIILRLLSVAPPGRLNFTIIDPVGLGQNFAGVMHLADFADHVINHRIWTQSAQIEQKLGDLNEHMEKVIQMYLRNEYATIAEYNEQAGNIAEKYHFLVVAGFPMNFTDTAARRLLSIAASGARCGVYTLIQWDRSLPLPPGFLPDELKKSSVSILHRGNQFIFFGKPLPGAQLLLDEPPSSELASEFIRKVGQTSRDSNRIEVPFSHVTPSDAELWTVDTTSELRVPIGRTGATKLQYLAIGKGTRQHALLAGKTGSGKSTLFHVIITNLALWSSPEQVEFYLVDFKKGVEFKCYATHHLPHARVIAIESDREFGLSVLQKLDDELKRRGELFRKIGAQDVAGYKKAGGTEPIPRTLLMIDEFQEFFTEEDRVAQNASVLLDRIVRQGRAFGIHVILGSQTLGGAYTMARTTIGQMVIRIALQCNEADAYLIMDDSNPAPRLLSRPGEGIYNDAAGAKEANSPFQAVWISDDERDSYLEKIRIHSEKHPMTLPPPIVFEGDAPADIRENPLLENLLQAEAIKSSPSARLWLGAPNSIKGPTEAIFHRQSGNNLLIVGQRDEAILAILSASLVALAAQYAPGKARFIVFDANPPGTPPRDFIERVTQSIPGESVLAKNNELPEIMHQLSEEMKKRTNGEVTDGPTTFLFIHGLQKFSKFRYEDDFSFSSDETSNPATQLNQLICEGASLGFHIILTCDTYNNINRFLSKKALTEFEMRVLFQMSANDSASLIDNPKAGTLGLNRALFYNEQEGYLEVFRPYSLPESAWIEKAAKNLARLRH